MTSKPAGNWGMTTEHYVKEWKHPHFSTQAGLHYFGLLSAPAQTGHSNAQTHRAQGRGCYNVRKEKVKILHKMAREM